MVVGAVRIVVLVGALRIVLVVVVGAVRIVLVVVVGALRIVVLVLGTLSVDVVLGANALSVDAVGVRSAGGASVREFGVCSAFGFSALLESGARALRFGSDSGFSKKDF